MKRVGTILMITFIMITFMIPYLRDPVFVFADSGSGSVGTDWNQVTTNDQMVQSFLAYCKSRDSNILGGTANVVANVTYAYLQKLSKTVGIDLNELQSELYYKQDSNQGLQWFMTSVGVTYYNQLFAQLISENGFEVGEPADQVIYSSFYFVDLDGNGCLVYEFPNNYDSTYGAWTKQGTPYRYTFEQIRNNGGLSATFHLSSATTANISYGLNAQGTSWNGYASVGSEGTYLSFGPSADGSFIISRTTSGRLRLSQVNFTARRLNTICYINSTTSDAVTNQSITFVSNNIKNEYQGDTYITNEGDKITNENITYNPYPDGGGHITPPTNTGGGSGEDDTQVTFPNFDFQLPEIDWSLGDLSEKFPFSIPFDLVAFFTVMNAEPQAPQIDANIPLGSWYTWRFQADFSQFDDYAVIIRNVEFIAFCIGLIYLTIKLVRG